MSSNKVGGLSGIIGELAACDGPRADWTPSDGFHAIGQFPEYVSCPSGGSKPTGPAIRTVSLKTKEAEFANLGYTFVAGHESPPGHPSMFTTLY